MRKLQPDQEPFHRSCPQASVLSSERIACILLLGLVLLGIACSSIPKDSKLQRFEFEEPQMGVPFRLVFFAPDEAAAARAAEAAYARVAELNAILSDYETDSELSRLSRSSEEGSPAVPLSPDLYEVLSAAQKMAHHSGGAFDVTIGPCASLWRYARREKQLPEPERIQRTLARVGYQNLVLNHREKTARLLKPGMRLDLGGIAKGYAADEALRILREAGFARALVAASGDLALGNPPPNEAGWKVELANPDATQIFSTNVLVLANCGVATSGDLFQRLEINGVRYSHIVSPWTCIGMTNHALATVIARDCMTADSLATAMTILPFSEALNLADRYGAAVRVFQVSHGVVDEAKNAPFTRIFREKFLR